MRIPNHPTYILRMLQHRLKQLATTTPVLAASFGQYTHHCGRPSCRCHHGGPPHVGQHLTFKEAGTTRSVYIPKELLPEVKTWLDDRGASAIIAARFAGTRKAVGAAPSRRGILTDLPLSRPSPFGAEKAG